jgi:NTP pyrophosphatase (non-canonical NTP hydrolase)
MAFKTQTPEPITMDAIGAEVMRARIKFPGNRFLLAALTEEVGELAQAMLQRAPKDEIEKEAIQVAAVAIRILEEGDASFDDITAAESKK